MNVSSSPVPSSVAPTSNSTILPLNEVLLFGGVAAVFAMLATITSTFLIISHLKHYSMPNHQRYVIRILLMVPVYAIFSTVSIFFYPYHVYVALLRDSYEAFVLYSFLVLCINYGGGFDNLSLRIAAQSPVRLAAPFHCVEVQPGREFLNWCRRGVLQYVFIKPVCALLATVLQLEHLYEDGVISTDSSFLYISLVVNVSVTAALYWLVFFYQATHEELAPYRPLLKFVCIKFVLFFSYWQFLVIVLLVQFGGIPAVGEWSSGETATAIQNVLICVEMLIAACMHIFAFPSGLYAMQALSKAPLIHSIEMGSWLQSVSDSANPRDVLADTVDSFVPEALRRKKRRVAAGSSAVFDSTEDDDSSTESDQQQQQQRKSTQQSPVSSASGSSHSNNKTDSHLQSETTAISSNSTDPAGGRRHLADDRLSDDDASLQQNRR